MPCPRTARAAGAFAASGRLLLPLPSPLRRANTAVGIAMPWIFKSTMGMYLFAGIAGLGYAVYSAVDQALLVDVLPNKEEAGKDLGILNMATTLGQMCGPVVMSAIVVNLGYNFAFPTSIALAIIGCFFIMAIKKVK